MGDASLQISRRVFLTQVEKVVERQVEVPQIQYVDEVVDVPMVKHRHVPTVVKQTKDGFLFLLFGRRQGSLLSGKFLCRSMWNQPSQGGLELVGALQ